MFEAVRTNPGYGMATLIYINLLNLILEVSRIIVPPMTQLLKSKWLNLFSRCTERKIESFWPKNLGQDFFLSVTQLFWSNFKFQCFNCFRPRWLIFSLGARSEKIESFWPKNVGQILVPRVFQFFKSKWLIFSLSAPSEKIESFWPKNLGQILVPPVIQFF